MKNDPVHLEWSVLHHENWKLVAVKTEKGLCYIGSPGQTVGEVQEKLKKRFPEAQITENHSSLKPYLEELETYFAGCSQSFRLPIDVQGSPFQLEVWEALKQIPYGKTVSYSEIAALINRPAAVRAVGGAIGANPVMVYIPCHRVIGKNGAITGFRGGLELKQFLMDHELNPTKTSKDSKTAIKT
ncbi:MAG TPA: methylated-DNA--[protein]-cysteine S-methyltransferase [Planococcus sp. (in: firmicutes)]|nr:methylated-DNA--[protein]-cysteine S-methyltransferase [Planococcus sp. (in: firmicutes)]